MTGVPVSKRHIGMLMQSNYGLIPHLDVFANISMPLRSGLVTKWSIERRVNAVAEVLQIQHLLQRKIDSLSGGEQQRVALARVLVKRPQLYLFDEPLMQLDTPSRLAARRQLVEIQRQTQVPCVYVTHDQPEAFALADRVAVINKGKIQQIGTRAELIGAPATLWVAQWLGFPPMNTLTGYLQGTYQREGMRYRVLAKSLVPLLPAKWTSVLNTLQCQDIILGIRPENIIPEWELRQRWDPSFCTVKVEVIASEWNQGKTLAQLQLPHSEDQFMAVFDIPNDQVKIGQVITIALDPDQFCLFHPRTQQLLHAPFVTPRNSIRL
jgi:ABC-type sugar transport system ATPase subunit